MSQGVVDDATGPRVSRPDQRMTRVLEVVVVEDRDVRPGLEVAVPLVDQREV